MSSQERPAARVSVRVSGYDPSDPDVIVTADPAELWQRYESELLSDGMEGKSPETVIRHVYEQNCEAPELEVEVDA